jgi:hypothetical protein
MMTDARAHFSSRGGGSPSPFDLRACGDDDDDGDTTAAETTTAETTDTIHAAAGGAVTVDLAAPADGSFGL